MLNPFSLERYFARHEFSSRYLLCTSDCESMTIDELCALDRERGGDGGNLGSAWLGYTESKGSPTLRAAIAGLYAGLNLDAILLHSGAEEAILNFYLATIEPGTRVIVNTPCYQSLQEIPRSLGAVVTPWRLRNDGERWTLDMAELREMLENVGSGAIVVVNMPHNPTGALLSRDEFDELIRLCRLYGATLFMDEVYRYLEANEADRLPAACEAYEKAISLSVLSKAWGLAGLRIGWLASSDTAALDKVAAVKDYNSICAAAPSEVLALLAVRQTEVITARNRKLCGQNRARFQQFFHKHERCFGWIPPVAGSVAFPWMKECPETSRWGAQTQNETAERGADRLAEELLRDTGILLLPGSQYGYDPSFFRIGLGRAGADAGIEIFDSWLNERGL